MLHPKDPDDSKGKDFEDLIDDLYDYEPEDEDEPKDDE